MPVTVANFLKYVDSGRYNSSFIHRSTTYNPQTIQIVQGGGFFFPTNDSISYIAADPPIILERSGSNLRGTLAMARTSDPNSATSQWFFNSADNTQLDSAYAVFGRVTSAQGLAVLDAFASVPVYNVSAQLGAVFSELPLIQPANNLIVIFSIERLTARITSFSKGTEGFQLNWATTPLSTPVNLERCTDLVGGVWEVISTGNTTGNFIDSSTPARRAFYRVVIP
jgi:cyclophilin family peptidyl-prolyl cis-trans isomerase